MLMQTNILYMWQSDTAIQIQFTFCPSLNIPEMVVPVEKQLKMISTSCYISKV